MPLLQAVLRIGSEEPCRFSSERPGEPRLCLAPAVRCIFCDCRTPRTRDLLRPLALLYIRDADTYREALLRVPIEKRARAIKLLRATLDMMAPTGYHSMLRVRRAKAVYAIAALAQNARDAPLFAAAVSQDAWQIRQATPLMKKVGDVPLLLILEYAFGETPYLHCSFSEAKHTGYSLSRHPAFVVDFQDDEEQLLANALSFLMQIHREALQQASAALAAYIRAAAVLDWQARAAAAGAALSLLCQMRRSATLPQGRPLCHKYFEPQESP